MIRSLSHLEGVLGYTTEEMEKVLSETEKNHYHFQRLKSIEKGERKYRHFFPSKRDLRDLQNRIQSRIFDKILLPSHIQGCTKGRGNITNAKLHQGKLCKLHTDLKSYFDFVSNKKVYDALRRLGFSPKVSNLLTRLTTFRGHLAQGPPTSPFLANIAALDMDEVILELCGRHGIIYSRYVDDLCCSSESDFKELVVHIRQIIEQHGFFIGFKKTIYKKGRIEITGADIGQNLLRPTKKQLKKYYDPETKDYTRKGLNIYFAGLRNKKGE
jgi:RNA-directed DNA polymerase